MVTETWIHQVQFCIISQALHNHNFLISDTASNKLHTVTQSQLTAPAEWYKHSSQLVSSVIMTVSSPTHPHHLAHKLRCEWEQQKYKVQLSLWTGAWNVGIGETAAHILILSTTWRSVVSFMPWSFYHQWKKPQVSLNKWLGGSQTHSRWFGQENYFLPLNNNSLVIHHTAWTLNQSYYSVSRKLAAIKMCL